MALAPDNPVKYPGDRSVSVGPSLLLPGSVAPEVPAWYPPWARELAELYFSRTTCLFVLHGNVHDLVRGPTGEYGTLADFLATQVFGNWSVVLHYDLARGVRLLAGADAKRHQSMRQHVSAHLGEPAGWPRDPETFLLAVDRFIERIVLDDDPVRRLSLGVVIEYGQYLVPAGDPGSLARGPSTTLVRLLGWAQNPYIKRLNMAFCVIADRLAEVNVRLVQSPHVAAIQVPLPDRTERERFCLSNGLAATSTDGFGPVQLADLSNGLSLLALNTLLAQGARANVTNDPARFRASFRASKKTLIERQCLGLVEFIEPKHTLDLVVGQVAAKERLQQDAAVLAQGRLEMAPMGYLLCGPVGTGKTFLAECYAGSVGIPCITLRNFRSKYVGETEGNLEQVLTVLRSLGPVVVVIDEADAALGGRQSSGDSGTSSRVFSMIAAQMGDTRYRGLIVWMLLTSRPDLLPIDLKRQGRAEVHIPLFYPQDEAEVRELFVVMARKNKVPLDPTEIPSAPPGKKLSGADIESIVLSARRRVVAAGRVTVQRADLDEAAAEFLPSAQGLEKELQELAAVLESTQLNFLPAEWRARIEQPNGRDQVQERYAAIKQLLDV